MRTPPPRRMVLPNSDRPFWQPGPNGSKHELLYLGWGERQFGDTPCPVTRHEGWMYFVVEDGSPTLVTETGRDRIKKWSAVIIGPDRAIGWDDVPGRTCRVLVWMWRSPVTPLLSSEPPDALRKIVIPALIMGRIQSLHALSREEVRMADHVMAVALSGLHQLLEATLVRPDGVETDFEQSAERVNLGIRWMESHLESRQPAVRIADYLGVSASTLHRLFKQETGNSPDAHFHQMKMTAARKRLGEGNPVKAVAYELGYRHPGDFTRAYTRHFGHSPATEKA